MEQIWTTRLVRRSMKVYEAIAKESAGYISVGDEITIAVMSVGNVNRDS